MCDGRTGATEERTYKWTTDRQTNGPIDERTDTHTLKEKQERIKKNVPEANRICMNVDGFGPTEVNRGQRGD